MDLIDLITQVAGVPSFSSYEDRLHPFIESVCERIPGVIVYKIPDNNLLLEVPGVTSRSPVALTAHLDKINHFGTNDIDTLPVIQESIRIIGQMDDSVGVGVCLSIMLESPESDFPPIYILFSEMEESFGLRIHPYLLRNNGVGLFPRIGANRIAEYILKNMKMPNVLITVDTTPKFSGKPGIALYSEFWHSTGFAPGELLLSSTGKLKEYFQSKYPELLFSESINDYLMYGKVLNSIPGSKVASIALEPAIYPYHTRNEGVYISDIFRVRELISNFLVNYRFI